MPPGGAGSGAATRLVGGPTLWSFRSTHVLEYFFTGLLVLVGVLVTAFAALAVAKLYQGQR